jgi:hypothetical protein
LSFLRVFKKNADLSALITVKYFHQAERTKIVYADPVPNFRGGEINRSPFFPGTLLFSESTPVRILDSRPQCRNRPAQIWVIWRHG